MNWLNILVDQLSWWLRHYKCYCKKCTCHVHSLVEVFKNLPWMYSLNNTQTVLDCICIFFTHRCCTIQLIMWTFLNYWQLHLTVYTQACRGAASMTGEWGVLHCRSVLRILHILHRVVTSQVSIKPVKWERSMNCHCIAMLINSVPKMQFWHVGRHHRYVFSNFITEWSVQWYYGFSFVYARGPTYKIFDQPLSNL